MFRLFLASLVASALAAHAQSPAPAFPAKNVTDVFFGTAVDDPYRALENEKDPEVAAWMKAQATHAQRTLESLPGHAALLKRVAELDNATAARIGSVKRTADGTLFFTRRGATDNVFKLYVRTRAGSERLLVDPESWQQRTGQPHAVDYFEPSPDGKLIAAGISAGGSELASLYVFESATGRQVDGPLERARYSQPQWLPDGTAFFYTVGPVLPPGAPASENFRNRKSYLHRLGTPQSSDVLVLGHALDPNVRIATTDTPVVLLTPGSRHAVALIAAGVQRERLLYTAPIEEAVKPGARWTLICDRADNVTDAAVHGEDIYLLSHASSPRFAVLRTKLAAPSMREAQVAVPPGDGVISEMAAARDGLYVEVREGALKELKRLAWGEREARAVRLPLAGAASILHARPDADGALVGLAAWTRARQIYLTGAEATVANTGLQPLGPFDAPADLVSEEVKVRSHDGAMVPLSILYRRGLKRDGGNPVILIGYGAYGITYDAGFDPTRIAFLEKGGVYAYANVRGSSAYGQDWYKAGFKATKPNTWKDFIACAEHLVAQGYASPRTLAILGGSAGGITVGRALTERPDLFAAAIPVVGMLDFVRLQVMPIGPVNVVEFGDVNKEDEFRGLLAMSSYHHVKPGTRYPAVLLQHGVNDGRVNVGQSNKMAARLMAATTSGKPVLLDLDYSAGHGQGMTKSARQRQIANALAFVLWQAGHPDFAP